MRFRRICKTGRGKDGCLGQKRKLKRAGERVGWESKLEPDDNIQGASENKMQQ